MLDSRMLFGSAGNKLSITTWVKLQRNYYSIHHSPLFSFNFTSELYPAVSSYRAIPLRNERKWKNIQHYKLLTHYMFPNSVDKFNFTISTLYYHKTSKLDTANEGVLFQTRLIYLEMDEWNLNYCHNN
ncbi:hypothetical protein T07_5578 [Trichinella nelsoni]|uniref:Uncharacterized protein n=1 Tax=Trichinella nelsoni TaxID=6336 RepID=A0A0V0SJP4_9BILA|nr:hypothetical protein T07_5578 [Trichinella nelsoni]